MNIGQAEGQSSTVALLPPPPALGGERREESLIIDLSFPLCMVWCRTEQRLTKQQYLEQIGITDLAAQKSLMAEIDRKYEEVSGRDRAGWKVDPPDVLVTGSGWLLREGGRSARRPGRGQYASRCPRSRPSCPTSGRCSAAR